MISVITYKKADIHFHYNGYRLRGFENVNYLTVSISLYFGSGQ